MDPLEAIELELDEEEDAAVYQWFYDNKPLQYTRLVNGPSYKRWKLPLPVMSTLYRLAGQVGWSMQPGMLGGGGWVGRVRVGQGGRDIEQRRPQECSRAPQRACAPSLCLGCWAPAAPV